MKDNKNGNLMDTSDAYHYGLDLSKVKLQPARKRDEANNGKAQKSVKQKRYVCIDLEMTDFAPSQRGLVPGAVGEVIQFGAVMLDEKFNMISKFSSYVKPSYSSVNEFINNLTGITNSALENADDFITVFDKFSSWRGEGDITTFCWSEADHKQLWNELNCKGKHRYDLFQILVDFVDLQKIFNKLVSSRTCVSLESAMKLLHMEFKGQVHSALSDSFNTARILHKLYCTEELEFDVDYINPSARHRNSGSEKNRAGEKYGCSFSSFMSPELLAQFGICSASEETEELQDLPCDDEETLWQVNLEQLKESPLNGIVDAEEISILCGKYKIHFDKWLRLATQVLETEEMEVA